MLEAASITWVFCNILFFRRMEDVLPASRERANCRALPRPRGSWQSRRISTQRPRSICRTAHRWHGRLITLFLLSLLNPDFWYPIDLGQYLDANGNSRCDRQGIYAQWIHWAETRSPL